VILAIVGRHSEGLRLVAVIALLGGVLFLQTFAVHEENPSTSIENDKEKGQLVIERLEDI
jgi:hypothetical protein